MYSSESVETFTTGECNSVKNKPCSFCKKLDKNKKHKDLTNLTIASFLCDELKRFDKKALDLILTSSIGESSATPILNLTLCYECQILCDELDNVKKILKKAKVKLYKLLSAIRDNILISRNLKKKKKKEKKVLKKIPPSYSQAVAPPPSTSSTIPSPIKPRFWAEITSASCYDEQKEKPAGLKVYGRKRTETVTAAATNVSNHNFVNIVHEVSMVGSSDDFVLEDAEVFTTSNQSTTHLFAKSKIRPTKKIIEIKRPKIITKTRVKEEQQQINLETDNTLLGVLNEGVDCSDFLKAPRNAHRSYTAAEKRTIKTTKQVCKENNQTTRARADVPQEQQNFIIEEIKLENFMEEDDDDDVNIILDSGATDSNKAKQSQKTNTDVCEKNDGKTVTIKTEDEQNVFIVNPEVINLEIKPENIADFMEEDF